MKKLISLLSAICLSVTANAAEAQDTIVVNHPKKVTVVEEDSLLKVEISGNDTDPSYRYTAQMQAVDSNYVSTSQISNDLGFCFSGFGKKNTDVHTSLIVGHAFAGFNSALGAPEGMSVKPFQSWDLGFTIEFERTIRKYHSVSLGFGFEWRNYRITDRLQFVKSDNGNVTLVPLPESSDPKFSRIVVGSFILPLRYQYARKSWGFSIGPILSFNNFSNIKTRYKLNGKKQKVTYKEVHKNPVTIDFMATVYTPLINFYAKYSPCNMLDTNYGPKFQSLSFGIFF